jgi:hypothetical protein
MRSTTLLFMLFLGGAIAGAQDKPLQQSIHGWHLSPHGTIRILVIFAEIEYDQNRGKDPQPDGADHWPKGQLPTWKDDVFDPFPLDLPKAMVSRYYHDISLGQYVVLGDYIDQLMTIRESEHRIGSVHALGQLAVAEANKMDGLRTKNGLSIEDFDMWKRGGRPGLPKEAGADDPHSYDHVMVIFRNSGLTHGQGSVDAGSPGALFGHPSDSQSRFGAMNGLPFEILKHEYNHLLLGGNNFHSGGGNAAQFQSYFINLQGGWSMMGAAGSSLLTCAAWDRQRLGWRAAGANHDVNAADATGEYVNGDIDPMRGDTGIYVLRDFVTTGDALRIKIPFIPEDRHQQWLWLENHHGYEMNGSPTDRFHWEEMRCIDPVRPGIFMLMQVDREDREGVNIFGGHADYLRPMPATGMYDLSLRGDTIFNACPFGGNSLPFRMDRNRANPLAGNHEQELPVHDKNNDGILTAAEHWIPGHRIRNGRVEGEAVFFGRPEHAFTVQGNNKIGMGTNPSTANMMTLVSGGTTDRYKRATPNVRTVYLNGISVELLDVSATGAVTIRVRTGDTRLVEDIRWCADSLVLPPLKGQDGRSLTLDDRVRLTIDRSITPTRINEADTIGGRIWFSDPTTFIVSEDADVLMRPGSLLDLRNGTRMHLMPGSSMELSRKARIRIDSGSLLVVHEGAAIKGEERMIAKLERRGRLERAGAGQ